MACIGASASFEGHTASAVLPFPSPYRTGTRFLPAVQFSDILCKTSGHNSTNAWRPHRVDRNFHCVFLEGVYLDRTEVGLKPRFVKVEPPSDADATAVLQQISRRVIRTLRRLGYLEAGIDAAMATGYDPLLDSEPELARTLAASVTQRIAFGERAGQKVRRIGSGFGYEGESPALTGPRCASLGGFSAPRQHPGASASA